MIFYYLRTINFTIMKKILFLIMALIASSPLATAKDKTVELCILETSDVHGSFFPYEFINRTPCKGSLARLSTYVKRERERFGDNLLLLDNGDILQGQPTVYYYNFIDTAATHVTAAMMNYLRYDAGNMGNHDMETGHAVYDRWIRQCNFPILGANIIDTTSGKPYLPPYSVFNRDGVKVAVIGLLTPSIPAWLPENLWAGLRFDDIEESARKWVKTVREKENPDVVVAIIHSGRDHTHTTGNWVENASQLVAERVPGIDIVLFGHDHQFFCDSVKNADGNEVWMLNPANKAEKVASAHVSLTLRKGKVVKKEISGRLVDISALPVDEDFMAEFKPQYDTVDKFVSQKIGSISKTISTRNAFFGPSEFIDLTHSLQLAISGAEVSMAAPLSFDSSIKEGDILVSDMFKLYKYENMLYTMRLSGREIKNYLEMSYDLWTNRMTNADDHLLLLKEVPGNGDDGARALFQNFSYNFDSAAGIRYTVDVTKPRGEKINILSMADGSAFDMDKDYSVAVNSYRGNGGGGLLTEGAGIPADKLNDRIIKATDKDLRFYLMEYIKKTGTICPTTLDLWKFIPEEWTVPAAKRDYKLLFKD